MLRIICSYPLPTGGRSLVLVPVPDGEHPITLVDIPAEGALPSLDGDCRVVDHELDDENAALRVAVDHMLESERLGRPADSVAA